MYIQITVILFTTVQCILTIYAALGHRSKRNIYQFKSMIECVTDRSAWDYADYGCYCGYGGKGQPVDGLDECCKKHDECWGEVMQQLEYKSTKTCSNPGFTTYRWKSNCKRGKMRCRGRHKSCARKWCECDRIAALCFANSIYNDEHYDIDLKRCTLNT